MHKGLEFLESDTGECYYVVPDSAVIAIVLNFNTAQISDPFAWSESDWGLTTDAIRSGKAMIVELGRCISRSEFQNLLTAIEPFVNRAKDGYLGDNDEGRASFSSEGHEAINDLTLSLETHECNREFTQTSSATVVVREDDLYQIVIEQLKKNHSEESLTEMSYDLARNTLPPFHPLEGYAVLECIREELLE